MLNKVHESRLYLKVFIIAAVLAAGLMKGMPVWADSVLTITLDANGGAFPARWSYEGGPVRTQDIELDDAGKNIYAINIGTDGKPEWSGKTLVGWSRDAKATKAEYEWQTLELITDEYVDPQNRKTMPLDGSVKYLYAVWADTFYITLDANGGDFGTNKDKYGKVTPIETMTAEFWYKNGSRCSTHTPNVIKRNSDEVHKGWSSNKNAVRPEYSTWFDGLVLNSSTPKVLYAIYGKENDKNSDYQDSGTSSKEGSGSSSSGTAAKKTNPMSVTTVSKNVKTSALKKKRQTLKKLVKVKNAKGTVTFSFVSKGTTKKLVKKVSVNKTTGAITIKKGSYKKGTCKIKIKVTAAGDSAYNKAAKSVTVKVKFK